MTEIAPTVGQRLKAERERRGMSAQKAADEMHLDAWVIDALETGDYQRIGPSVYAKGHLKKYASILGISPAEIMAGYDTRSAASVASAPQPASIRMRSGSPDATNLPWPQLAAFTVIALVIGGILWWRPWHQRTSRPTAAVLAARPPPSAAGEPAQPSAERSTEPQSADSDTPQPIGSASAAAVSPTPAAATLTGAPSGSAGPAGDTDSAGVGRARLRLSFSADSWVDVHDSAGHRVFAGSGRANSVKTLGGAAPLRVYLSVASGVQLELNGRAIAIGPQFVSGDVARFEAGADGVLRRDSHAVPATDVPTNGVPIRTAPPHG
jgi:cytoskeleton protein RodZ